MEGYVLADFLTRVERLAEALDGIANQTGVSLATGARSAIRGGSLAG
jgi:hypothetical protein